MLDGRKYLVCDPTYINAGIGEAMPQYKQIKAEVMRVADLKRGVIKIPIKENKPVVITVGVSFII